jgi:hypothetical protein
MAGFRKAKGEQAALKLGVYGPQGSGKAQPVDEPVLTPNGFVPIGSLKVGDVVIGRDGLPAPVLGVFPRGRRPVFRVRFTDNTETRCCDQHLWVVQRTHGDQRWHVFPLKELRLLMEESHGTRWGTTVKRWKIPLADAVEFRRPPEALPLHPYVLGCLLGDGCFRTSGVNISTADPLLVERMGRLQPDLKINRCGANKFNYYVGNCVGRIKQLGLHGTDSESKFIPTAYLLASREDRLEMLRGLCDTDGCRNVGYVDVTLKSKQLAEGVAFLARSLGFRTSVRPRKPPMYCRVADLRREGRSHEEIATMLGSTVASVMTTISANKHRPVTEKPHAGYHRVVILCDDTNELLTLPRKQGEVRQMKYRPADMKVIRAIEPCGEEECVCIAVGSDDNTYLTRDFIVTHNSMSSLLFAEGLAKVTGKRVAFVDTEHGTDFYAQEVKERKVHPAAFDFDALYTRSLTEILAEVTKLREEEYGVVVIDSMTHVWEAAMNAYRGKRTSVGSIPISAWGSIKKPYKALMAHLLSTTMHVVICARQSVEYEKNEDGELTAVGLKMKAEGETAYEPHILIRMEAVKQGKAQVPVITAFVEKDRTGILQGRAIENPTFEGVVRPILGVLGHTQAAIPTDEETAARDAEVLAQQERDRAVASRRHLEEFKARITLAKDLAALKAIGKEITPQLKREMLPADVQALRDAYLAAQGMGVPETVPPEPAPREPGVEREE